MEICWYQALLLRNLESCVLEHLFVKTLEKFSYLEIIKELGYFKVLTDVDENPASSKIATRIINDLT